MPKNSNSFMISPHTIGWLGWAGRFCCCSHLRSATCDHSQMVMGLHSQVLCLRGSGRSLASARAPPCRSRHPFLHHFQQGSWTSQRAAQGSPIIPQLLITSVWLQGVSGRVWISAVEDNTKTSISETWSLFGDWLPQVPTLNSIHWYSVLERI